MPTSTIKKQLHDYIDIIEDTSELEILYQTAEVQATAKKSDIIDS